MRHYVPLTGAVSHSLFSVHILSPSLVTQIFPLYDLAVSNAILFQSHLGIGFYVYYRQHLLRLKPWDRVEYSVFTSVMFNFGTLLFAVLLKGLLPRKIGAWPRSLLGLAMSFLFISRGMKFIQIVDRRASTPVRENGALLNSTNHLTPSS
uniref:Uncharacterized protein n=1 Tax=Acrobeloides nanus TaxID=290746 RepID=A0A914C6X3_9BILA